MATSKKQRRKAPVRSKRFLAVSLAAKKGWATRRAQAAIAELEKRARAQARQSKTVAKHTRETARGFKAELEAAKKGRASLKARAELAKRVARTVEHTKAKLPKLAPESERVELAQASHYPEGRTFMSGHAFTGYLDGRPGVQGVLSISPLLNPERREVSSEARESAEEEIEGTDAAQVAKHEADDYDAWLEGTVDAYLAADDGGAFIECDVDSDSAGADSAS